MNLTEAFRGSAQAHAEKVALLWADQRYTYADLWNSTVAMANRLRKEMQVKPGDRVGIWLKNCPEFVPAFLGTLQAGAIVVPINNFLKPQEVAFVLKDAGIDLLITEGELASHGESLVEARKSLRMMLVEAFRMPHQPDPSLLPAEMPLRQQDDVAILVYTSGTTGHPKGAMLSHGNLLHNVESCRIVLQAVEGDRFAVLLPLFHSYMITVGMLLPLLTGGSMLLVRALHPVHTMLTELMSKEASVLPAIPSFFRNLLAAPPEIRLPLRLCISGAAPLPMQVLKDFEARFKVPLSEGYGLSEASPVVTKNPLNGHRKPGSVGLPIPNVEVSIQDDSGRILGTGEVGEICVRGGNVMRGYWDNPAETEKTFRAGWLLTGDVGYRDEEGYYFITDRKKDMLLVNGCNVYPREIEEVLYTYPGIKEAAVVGMPDPRRGEHPVAFVATNEGAALDEAAVQKFLRTQIADYKVPKRVITMPALPRNATGKILKTSLRQITV